jgi:hypothetical protein
MAVPDTMFSLWILLVITFFPLHNFVTLVFHAHLMMKGSQSLTRNLMKLFSRDSAMAIFIL